jgi:dTDP-4-amino-4,6-dideoxygalactose transaminase
VTDRAVIGLAVHGGPKVRTTPMPPRRALLGGEMQRALDNVVRFYEGRNEDPGYQGEFERQYCGAFADWMGTGGYADAVSTGTAAVFVALAALELPPGSSVVVSPITDPGTISAIIFNDLKPAVMDSRPGSVNSGAEDFERRIRPDTSAVVVVHAAGMAADIVGIADIARRRGIRIVEDCSQAHGALVNGRKVGTFGDIAAFSTMYRKAHATGGSGGVVFTRDRDLFHRVRAHADRGKPSWRDGFDEKDARTCLYAALNFHTDEISCAIGIESLARLPDTIERRRSFVRQLAARLRTASRVCEPTPIDGSESPFFYPIHVQRPRLACSKTTFAQAVKAEGIDLNPDYRYVVCEWPWVQRHLAGDVDCPNAVEWRESSFNLLLNENYGPNEVDDIVSAIVKVEGHYGR